MEGALEHSPPRPPVRLRGSLFRPVLRGGGGELSLQRPRKETCHGTPCGRRVCRPHSPVPLQRGRGRGRSPHGRPGCGRVTPCLDKQTSHGQCDPGVGHHTEGMGLAKGPRSSVIRTGCLPEPATSPPGPLSHAPPPSPTTPPPDTDTASCTKSLPLLAPRPRDLLASDPDRVAPEPLRGQRSFGHAFLVGVLHMGPGRNI